MRFALSGPILAAFVACSSSEELQSAGPRSFEKAAATILVSATPVSTFGTSHALVHLAIADLADRLGIPTAEIMLVQVIPVSWPDASLGCPKPGRMYAQVITPGYRIMLDTADQRYNYHSDTARRLILCGPGKSTYPPPPGSGQR